MAQITVRTNGQTLKVAAYAAHWTSAALAAIASGNDDVASGTTLTITSDYTFYFANNAETATIGVWQLDGTQLALHSELPVHPGVGPRVLNPVPDVYQSAADDTGLTTGALPAGALAETFPRWVVCANTAVLTSARLSVAGISLRQGMTISSISFISATTALVAGDNQWFALYNSAGALLAQTADVTSEAWAANSVKTLALTAPVTTTYSGLHYLAIMVKASGGNVPTLAAQSPIALTYGQLPKLSALTADNALAAAAPAPLGAFSNAAGYPYAYVS